MDMGNTRYGHAYSNMSVQYGHAINLYGHAINHMDSACHMHMLTSSGVAGAHFRHVTMGIRSRDTIWSKPPATKISLIFDNANYGQNILRTRVETRKLGIMLYLERFLHRSMDELTK